MRWTIGRAIASAVIGVLGLSGPAAAQEMWLGPTHGGSLAIEVAHVHFSDPDLGPAQSSASAAVFLTARIPLWQRTALVIELPAARGSFSSWDETMSDFAIGNPYVGVEGGQSGTKWFGEAGVRLPIMSETKIASALVGMASDLDRMEAFLPDVAAVSAYLNGRSGGATGFRIRMRVGPLLDIPTRSGMGDAELFGAYALQVGVASKGVEIFTGVTGRMLITQDASNQLTDQFVSSLHLNLGRVEPGVDIRVPLDNGQPDLIGSVFGVSLRMAF